MLLKKLLSIFLAIITTNLFLVGCSPLNGSSSKTIPSNLNNNNFILYKEENLKKITTIKDDNTEKAIKKITGEADKILKDTPLSVTGKKVLPNGASDHDFVSLSIYYWPDQSKPNGLPYIYHDGRTNPELKDTTKYDAEKKTKMVRSVNVLSLSYYISGKEEYASKATDFLRAWFINDSTKMNPNMNYGESIPGKSNGTSSGIIESVPFIELTDSIRMLESSKSWTSDDDKSLKSWFSQYTDWLVNSSHGKGEAEASNNHGVWYDAQVAAYAYFTGNDALAKTIVGESKEKRIAKQIEPDGKMPLELERTNSFGYTMYNLEAFILLASVGDKVGIDIWSYSTQDGRSIKKALDYFNSYVEGRINWTYQNIDKTSPTQIAPYIAIANEHFKDKSFTTSIEKMLPKNNAQEIIKVYSNLSK
ncbi:alginate lyase family protein [Bacillus mycoides]|uniref:alginate lyase family protein n=1 Tax=Bacillus mycoides TaxID=1405 RepID=UPI003F756C7A